MKTKTIDVNAKEWIDKKHGNSYFCGTVTLNYGMKNEETFLINPTTTDKQSIH